MVPARTVIAIASSAGGVRTLMRLIGHLPADFPAAALVVQHTAPGGPGLLAEIIGRVARLPVAYGARGDPVQAGRVYIAPPGPHMSVTWPGLIHLDYGPKENYSRPAADVLFRSAAKVYGKRAIGLVLTGYDSDGTKGLQAIKGAGGITIVQDPRDAEVPNMPLSALVGDSPDHCVPLDRLPALLVRLAREVGKRESEMPATMP